MDRFHTLIADANKAMETADHLAYVTYPVVNDVKLLMVVVEHVHRALLNGMHALLHYDALYKRISPVPEDFKSQFLMFKASTSRRYHIHPDELLLIQDIKELMDKRKASPMEFARKDKFVIASRDYKLRTLTMSKVKNYLTTAKTFIKKVNEVQQTSGRRFT